MTDVELPAELLPSTIGDLRRAVEAALATAEPLVLRGGDPFCSGLGLGSLREPEADRVAAVREFAEVLITLRLAEVPVVAVVRHAAAGGGVGLAAAADWVIAAPTASFALPELPHGLFPATILPVLSDRLRPHHLRQLVMEALPIPAGQALALGLVDQVVHDDGIDTAVRRKTRTLGRAAPTGISALKQALLGPSIAEIRSGAEQTAADICDPTIVGPIIEYLDGGPPPWIRS